MLGARKLQRPGSNELRSTRLPRSRPIPRVTHGRVGLGPDDPRVMGEAGLAAMPNVKRHLEAINAHPAAQRAEALKERFAFKQEMDDEAKRAMFPQNARLAAG